MAFVFKSRKDQDIKIGETNDIGPGEYLPQTDLKTIKVSKEPFLIGEKRSIEKFDDVPGPGAYYQDDVLLKYLKNVQNEKIIEQNDKDQLFNKDGTINLKPNVEKLGFTTKERRFKDKSDFDTPGPGFYFPPIKKKDTSMKSSTTYAKEMKKMKKLYAIKKENVIPSIPTHNQDFGFDITKNGELCRKTNPEMYKTFSGEKGDTVGPGSYEIDQPNQWHKTGTEWSKFKTKRDSTVSDKTAMGTTKFDSNIMSLQTTGYSDNLLMSGTNFYFNNANNNNGNIFQDTKASTEINFFKPKSQKDKKNSMKCRIVNCKIANQRASKEIKKDFESIIGKNFPGPGYYYDNDKLTAFNPKPNPEYKQFFGSKMERFKNFNNTMDDNQLSPATYFNNDENEKSKGYQIQQEKMSRTAKNFAPFYTRTNRFFKIANKFTSPGPGQYNPSSVGKKSKNFSSTFSKFGSTEKRFSENKISKWQFDTPGPGSYIDPYSATGTFNTVKFRGMIVNIEKAKTLSRPHHENINADIRSFNVNKNIVPPVGQYNSAMIFSIDYNNQKKKLKQANNKEVAFNSGKSKKVDKVEMSNLGPGYYYKEKKTVHKQMFPPFNQSDRKWKNQYVGEFLTGPGQYNTDSYFNWNKKTYNINFV